MSLKTPERGHGWGALRIQIAVINKFMIELIVAHERSNRIIELFAIRDSGDGVGGFIEV